MVNCCPWWVCTTLGGKKHLAVFYKPSWTGNHTRPILFTSLGSCYLQIQHSWCPCCRSSTWSNAADACLELWHHSRQIGSWGTAVLSEPPVLQSHWQMYPGAINSDVPSPDALFPLQGQGGFGVPSCFRPGSPGNSVRSPSASQLKCVRPQRLRDIWHF